MPPKARGSIWYLQPWIYDLIAAASRPFETFLPGVGRQWFVNDGQSHNPQPEHSATARAASDLRSPHYNDVDLSLHKDFPITERFRLQFRSDFVNASTTPSTTHQYGLWCHYGPDHQCSTA